MLCDTACDWVPSYWLLFSRAPWNRILHLKACVNSGAVIVTRHSGTSIRSAGAFILLIASKKPPGVITAIRWTSSEVMSHAWDRGEETLPLRRRSQNAAAQWVLPHLCA
jgi:hypothetical protein